MVKISLSCTIWNWEGPVMMLIAEIAILWTFAKNTYVPCSAKRNNIYLGVWIINFAAAAWNLPCVWALSVIRRIRAWSVHLSLGRLHSPPAAARGTPWDTEPFSVKPRAPNAFYFSICQRTSGFVHISIKRIGPKGDS